MSVSFPVGNNALNQEQKKTIKHKIGWCFICGFVHDNVRPYTMVENGHTVIKPICESCRRREKTRDRMVVCAICGLVKGDTLYATTVERLSFDEQNTCNFIVPLCKECRSKPHKEIREKLNLATERLCDNCPDRFKCYTSQHGKPVESRLYQQDPLKFQRNPKINKKGWWR